jgi:hypothetical protein
MSKQLIDRKEQGRIIAKMNGSINRIGDSSYTVSPQSGSSKLGVLMKRGLKIHERKIGNKQQPIRNRFHERVTVLDV